MQESLLPPNPSGVCQCGCGEKTGIASRTDPRGDAITGQYVRFRQGHGRYGIGSRSLHKHGPNPDGWCMCGCGKRTGIATSTDLKDNTVKGQNVRFVKGHGGRIHPHRAPIAPNPSDLCMCGCGQKTPLSTINRPERGHIKGKPVQYVPWHSRIKGPVFIPPPNPSGVCMCGCGQKTAISKRNNRKFGHVKGHPVSYIAGHGIAAKYGPREDKSDFCACGCGGITRSAKNSDAGRGRVRGQANAYVKGHGARKPLAIQPHEYVVVDMGWDTPCWAYLGALDRNGYGIRGRVESTTTKPHRQSYEEFVGPIPEGITINHMCRHAACINPEHLEPLPNADNVKHACKFRIPKKTRQRIFDRDGNKCLRCGRTDRLTIDHIKPESRGGTHDDANLRTLCKPCNSKKGRFYFLDERAAEKEQSAVAAGSGNP